jgi:hypothetical protein
MSSTGNDGQSELMSAGATEHPRYGSFQNVLYRGPSVLQSCHTQEFQLIPDYVRWDAVQPLPHRHYRHK